MSDAEQLANLLFASPDDFTLAAALVEELETVTGLWRTEADQKAEDVIRRGRLHRDHTRAAALLSEKSKRREQLLARVIGMLNLSWFNNFTILVIEGEGPPQVRGVASNARGYFRHTQVVTIPARWLLDFHKSNAREMHEERQRANWHEVFAGWFTRPTHLNIVTQPDTDTDIEES